MNDMANWTEVLRREKSFPLSEWADYHATGHTRVLDPWWDKDGMWDPPLPMFEDAEISAWVADMEMNIIMGMDFPGAYELDPDSDEWRDSFYVAIAQTLGWNAAEAADIFGER